MISRMALMVITMDWAIYASLLATDPTTDSSRGLNAVASAAQYIFAAISQFSKKSRSMMDSRIVM
jgi:hypothetical protein